MAEPEIVARALGPMPVKPPAMAMSDDQARALAHALQPVVDAFREWARSFVAALGDVAAAFRRLFPAPLLLELSAAAKYERRMEAHWHRTAGRPRSRRRPGRCRR